MSTKALLVTTVVVELFAGIALLTVPVIPAACLFGDALDSVAANVIARVAGIAVTSIAVMCFFARNSRGPATNSIVTGLLTYNAAVSLLLMQVALEGPRGPFLWPTVALHLLLACWCLIRLRAA
ncbi:MAG TPA: hypothetical protein VMT33_03995 [Candidatus Bathyarchaeia archaeon]|nr:hypothetical protein [Candidatus Bathyarchaeia archaeon]